MSSTAIDGMRAPRSVSFITMGCAKNEADTAHMRSDLIRAGYRIADDPAQADAVVVNTCSFIQAATEESIEVILDAAGLDNVASGRARLVVSGCMPARYGDELEAEVPEAAAFVPCAKEDQIVEVIDRLLGVERSLGAIPTAVRLHGPAASEQAPPSAYVKISDGCNRFCSFCSIPYIRGRYRSFPYERIRDEVSALVAAGTREVVLIAQDTGRWGDDFDEPLTLGWLVATLADEFPRTWLRVMYIQPEGVTDELIEAVAAHDNVCSYFDVPFQHVSPRLLKLMRRTGSVAAFDALCARIRARIPDATLRTTLIAGFPGETDDEFEQLCAYVENCDLDYVGVFAYSREEGTRAFDLPDQVDDDEKDERARRLRELADAVCAARVAQRVGRVLPVLVCGTEEDGQLVGRAMCQAPDVDGVTYVEGAQVGEVVAVRIDDTLLYEMEGTVVP
ncbi:30S ribosomal protein S12 methylthiotransferase RimO [Berryella wangjianweii]|uniref:Ribosomal protein uS12 methylthiotransferase RimO n=1 Tax=Berryella wangjianweii TaxID=2734634 RepID=A0A6M8J1K9_9ACTN|nr:30S ribosomal protein S12 methylthiotransferase RimO [Berryella wangjianweii]QKF06981.1 30S ribosomal protein S12 methylthiotransferase RimO [Berryella wangjianweii]